MKIVVIGLGSMGKRRIRLIKELYPTFEIVGIDARQDRRDEVASNFGIACFGGVSDVRESVDCAFICTSPLSHASIIKECLLRKWHVFTEINLVADGYTENIALAKQNGCKLFLSSTFFYREETKYIRSVVTRNEKWNYMYHIGQYLPDWHPWENIKDFFVGDKRTNGCREILAIELPWLTATFGPVGQVRVLRDKISALPVDYNDNYAVQIAHENGNKGLLMVDVVCPVAVRNFHAYTEGKYVSWNGTPDSVFRFDPEAHQLTQIHLAEETEHEAGYRAFIVENAYKNEITEFFDVVTHNKKPLYGFEEDLQLLTLIDCIETE